MLIKLIILLWKTNFNMKQINNCRSLMLRLAYLCSFLLCLGLFLALLPDIWTKFSSKYTTTRIHFLDEKNTNKKPLPCVTLCPWSLYNQRGFHYLEASFQTQTFQVESFTKEIEICDTLFTY